MRVLHVLPTRDASYGGPVAVVNEYARELAKQGVDAGIFPDDGARTWRRLFYFPGVISLKRLIDSISAYDLIHIHGLWYVASALVAWAARAKGIPYLITPHGMLDQWAFKRSWLRKRLYYWAIEKRNLQHAASVHLLNAGEYEASKRALGDVRTFVLPNGVDTSAYGRSIDKVVLTSIFPELEGKLVLLFLGRINFKKGLDVLIPAFERARNVNHNLHLIIAGPDDGYLDRLKKLIVDHNISDYVTLTGMVSGQQKLQVFAAAHMFILISDQEADSLALKEAMAAGLPTIVSAACNFSDVTEYDCGLVVPHNIGVIAEVILTLANDRLRLAAMGARAKQLMRSRYNWAMITEHLIAQYRVILGYRAK